MEIYLAETFTKDWIFYANKCKNETHKYEHMLCDALLDNKSNFANMLLDLDLNLIKDFGYFFHNNMTALMIAAHRGDLIIIKKLKDKGTNINAYNGDGTNALMFAIFSGRYKSVKILIDLGVDINFQCKYNGDQTPLMMAADRRQSIIFTMLLEAGADINIKNKNLLTITDILNRYLSDDNPFMTSEIKTMNDILNKKKENDDNITSMNKPKNKCNYGTNCLNFKNGSCSLDHIVNCVYGKDCINDKQGICLLEH